MHSKIFNEAAGKDFLARNTSKVSRSLLVDIDKCSYVVMCVPAVFEFLRVADGLFVHENTLILNLLPICNTAFISRQTAEALELLASNHDYGGDKSFGRHGPCLLSVLDHCITTSGRNLLRSTILAPSTDRKIIMQKHNLVEELLSNESIFFGIQTALLKCPNHLEKTLSWGIRLEKRSQNFQSYHEQTVSQCILMLEALEVLPEIQAAIHFGQNPILKKFTKKLENTAFTNFLQELNLTIQPNVRFKIKVMCRQCNSVPIQWEA